MRPTVLVVEDDEDIQAYYRVVLGPLDADLVAAATGREALQVLDSGRRVDVILLDVVMPVMDGEEFFRILRRERHLQVPVILSSVDTRMGERVMQHGEVQGVFLKGSGGTALVNLLRRQLAAGSRSARTDSGTAP